MFRIRAAGDIDATVYEPAKEFRNVALALAVGDRVRVVGSTRRSPRTINVEKIHVVELARLTRKVANPRCTCGKSMKSSGRDGAFRCARCRRRVGRERADYTDLARSIRPGWYQPPVGSRRHLSMPLQRMERTVVGRLPIDGPPPTLAEPILARLLPAAATLPGYKA